MDVSIADQVTDPIAYHGEGVIWDHVAGVVRWLDVLAGDVLTQESDARTTRHHLSRVVAAIRPRVVGGLVAGIEDGFLLTDPSITPTARLRGLWTDPMLRMNDGGCDPEGRFFCGSMDSDERPNRGRLYRLEADLTVTPVLDAVSISNGLAWSPEGTEAYYVDSATHRIDVFDYDSASGSFRNRRPFVVIPSADGTPDGIAVDADGSVWVALWSGSAVRRYLRNGRVDGEVRLPTRHVTSCAFAGEALNELYITSSRLGRGQDCEPEAGALFRVRPGVQGNPPVAFAG